MKEIIVGIHSIREAIKNPKRSGHKILAQKEGIELLRKESGLKISEIDCEIVSSHEFQKKAEKIFKENGHHYKRVAGGIILITELLEELEHHDFWNLAETKGKRFLCLDQVTDVHNGAAITRTAAFYGIDVIIMGARSSFGLTPSFYRVSSGAREHLQFFRASSLPKLMKKMNEKGVVSIALSEHEEESLENETNDNNICLVLGSEETGISHALLRSCQHKMALKSQGGIKSLNVSVASAVAMEKIYGAPKKNLAQR